MRDEKYIHSLHVHVYNVSSMVKPENNSEQFKKIKKGSLGINVRLMFKNEEIRDKSNLMFLKRQKLQMEHITGNRIRKLLEDRYAVGEPYTIQTNYSTSHPLVTL